MLGGTLFLLGSGAFIEVEDGMFDAGWIGYGPELSQARILAGS